MPDSQLDTRPHPDHVDNQNNAHLSTTEGEAEPVASGLQLPIWIQALIAGWKLIVLGAVIAAAAAAIFLLLQPKKYVAEALVAPVFSSTQVQFEPRIKTVDSTTNLATTALSPERRQALLDLVNTGEVEHAVILALNGRVSTTPTNHGDLVGNVRGGLRPKSEMISIQAEADTSDDAVMITNAWAVAYADLVNRVYGSQGSSLDKLQQQRDDALAQYQQDQAGLTTALQTNQQAALDRQINDLQHQIAMLQSPYQAGDFGSSASPVNTSTNNQQSNSTNSTSTSSTNTASTADTNPPRPAPAVVDPQTARSDYRLAELRTLDGLAENLRRLDVSQQNIKVLQSHVASGQASPADEAALAVLKTQLVSMTSDVPQLQLQVNVNGSSTDTAAELAALQDSISQARSSVSAEFDARRADFEAKSATQIAALEDQLRSLKSQSEIDGTQLKQLTLKRDLSWDTYTALARKVDEQAVAQSSGGQQVEVASRASVGVPSIPRTPYVVAAAAVAGAVLAAIVLLIPLVYSALAPYMTRRRQRAMVLR